MLQLVDRTLCLLYRVLPAAHSQEQRQTADAFALWAGEWIDLMHHMGFVVEIPPDLQFAAASAKARRTVTIVPAAESTAWRKPKALSAG